MLTRILRTAVALGVAVGAVATTVLAPTAAHAYPETCVDFSSGGKPIHLCAEAVLSNGNAYGAAVGRVYAESGARVAMTVELYELNQSGEWSLQDQAGGSGNSSFQVVTLDLPILNDIKACATAGVVGSEFRTVCDTASP